MSLIVIYKQQDSVTCLSSNFTKLSSSRESKKSYIVFIYLFFIDMSKVTKFAYVGMLFVFSILLANGNGLYSPDIAVMAEQENSTKVNVQSNEKQDVCTDTNCENENKIKKSSTVINGTQFQEQNETKTKLNVTTTLTCMQNDIISPCPDELGPDDFIIYVKGNNSFPSQSLGSSQGILFTLGAGEYYVNEEPNLELPENFEWSATFWGDCVQNDDFAANGTMTENDKQICGIENQLNIQETE